MNAYTSLPRFYDSLTADVPYHKFAEFYERVFSESEVSVKTILDLACGTGTLTHVLAKRGYEMIGTDSSPDMLALASDKCCNLDVAPIFLCQPAERLDLYGTVDAAVCSLDGINYLDSGRVVSAFERVHLFLEPSGIFVFDLLTPDYLRELDGMVFSDEAEDVFCVWRCSHNKRLDTCVYDMDIFSKAGALWRRDCEKHIEYIHEVPIIKEWLSITGFSEIKEHTAKELDTYEAGKHRVFISARKRGKQKHG